MVAERDQPWPRMKVLRLPVFDGPTRRCRNDLWSPSFTIVAHAVPPGLRHARASHCQLRGAFPLQVRKSFFPFRQCLRGKVPVEKAALELHPLVGPPIPTPDGDEILAGRENFLTMHVQKMVQRGHQGRPVNDLPIMEHVEDSLPQVEIVEVFFHVRARNGPSPLGPLLQVPVGQLEKKGTFWVARIRPAESGIREILQGGQVFGRLIQRGRWIGIEAAGLFADEDQSRHGDVDFKAPGVGMGRHVDMRTGLPRDAGPSRLEEQIQGQVDLATKLWVARVEGRHIDVGWLE